MTEPVHSRLPLWQRTLAGVWLLAMVFVAWHQWHFWQAPSLDTDIFALLPADRRDPTLDDITHRIAETGERRIVIAIGAQDEQQARAAASLWRQSLPPSLDWREQCPDTRVARALVQSLAPWRDRLLTPEQRAHLQHADVAALATQALARLYQPGQVAPLTPFVQDPLGLWPQWWSERGSESRARPQSGEWMVSDGGREWVVLLYNTQRPVFSLDGEPLISQALHAAEQATRARFPEATVLRAGIALHAEAAAVQASHEVNTVGWGSLIAVLLLARLAFGRSRPLLLVGASLLAGVATATAVTVWVFGQVHILTMVFGTSLVGVAEDYGLHYFAARQQTPHTDAAQLNLSLMPGLLIALGTSVLGYAVMAWAPFPGLRQMAVFSATGLVAAYLTVLCWFPLLEGTPPPPTRSATWIGSTLARWPRLCCKSRWHVALVMLALVATASGLWRLRIDDSLRQLQSSPADLIAQQRDIGRLLGLPSPTQFFVVQGKTPDELLTREEALTDRLRPLVEQGQIAGWRAVSDWLPSPARQTSDAALSARVESAVLASVGQATGETLTRPSFAPHPLHLQQDEAARKLLSTVLKDLWPNPEVVEGTPLLSVVMLRGITGPEVVPALQAAAQGLPGVQWGDKVDRLSTLMAQYRSSTGWLLLLGHVLILALLALRYRTNAWRAWLPTAVASLLALATLGWLGIPLQLFGMLALLLLLGVGVDYGIFLLEHPDDGAAWLAVVLGAASTALSFGLLGLSRTPALHTFGLTLGVGLVIITICAPLLRPTSSSLEASALA